MHVVELSVRLELGGHVRFLWLPEFVIELGGQQFGPFRTGPGPDAGGRSVDQSHGGGGGHVRRVVRGDNTWHVEHGRRGHIAADHVSATVPFDDEQFGCVHGCCGPDSGVDERTVLAGPVDGLESLRIVVPVHENPGLPTPVGCLVRRGVHPPRMTGDDVVPVWGLEGKRHAETGLVEHHGFRCDGTELEDDVQFNGSVEPVEVVVQAPVWGTVELDVSERVSEHRDLGGDG